MANGECLCAAVGFDISAEITDVIICHCSICRRSTGGTGIAVVVIDNDAFRWTRGEDRINTWKKPGRDWQTWFCRDCGSPLPGIELARHIYVGSRASWEKIPGGVVQ